jgi:hypothetical protein
MGALGPYFAHLTALTTNLDGRTKEARILKATRAEMLRLLGHKPNGAELAAIERIAWLQLRIQIMDARMLDGKASHFDTQVYNANCNSLTKALNNLGVIGKARAEAGKSGLANYFLDKRRA